MPCAAGHPAQSVKYRSPLPFSYMHKIEDSSGFGLFQVLYPGYHSETFMFWQ